MALLGKYWEERVDAVKFGCVAVTVSGVSSDKKVVFHSQAGENAVTFEYVDNAGGDDRAGRLICNIGSGKFDPAGILGDQSADGMQNGALAGSVSPKQHHKFPRVYSQIDTMDNLRFAVGHPKSRDIEEYWTATGMRPRSIRRQGRHESPPDRGVLP